MMWAVAYMNFFDNELRVEIVEANTLIEAISKHSKLSCNLTSWLNNMPNDLAQIQIMFFDADAAIDVVEIDIAGIQKKGRGTRTTESPESRDSEPS